MKSGQYVAFEWIGEENYLGEKISRHGKRTRGANFTSADAMVMVERIDGKRHILCVSSFWPTKWNEPKNWVLRRYASFILPQTIALAPLGETVETGAPVRQVHQHQHRITIWRLVG